MHVLIISHVEFGIQPSLSVAFFFRQTLLANGAGSPFVLENVYIIRSVQDIVGTGKGILQ
jgi:hypothetical protein